MLPHSCFQLVQLLLADVEQLAFANVEQLVLGCAFLLFLVVAALAGFRSELQLCALPPVAGCILCLIQLVVPLTQN